MLFKNKKPAFQGLPRRLLIGVPIVLLSAFVFCVFVPVSQAGENASIKEPEGYYEAFRQRKNEIAAEERERYKEKTGKDPLYRWGTAFEVFGHELRDLPETFDIYTNINELPTEFAHALETGLSGHMGRSAFKKLELLIAVRSPAPERYFAQYALRSPLEGLAIYVGSVWLDADLQIVETEFPKIDGGISAENFLGIPELQTLGFIAGYDRFPKVSFEDGTLKFKIEKNTDCRKIKTRKLHQDGLVFTSKTVDMRTGALIEEKEYSEVAVSNCWGDPPLSCEKWHYDRKPFYEKIWIKLSEHLYLVVFALMWGVALGDWWRRRRKQKLRKT